jgi:hypothetical protein
LEQGITAPTVATPRKRAKNGTGDPSAKKAPSTPSKKRKLPEAEEVQEGARTAATTRVKKEPVEHGEERLTEGQSLFGI